MERLSGYDRTGGEKKMTEETLKKAECLDRQIRDLQSEKKDLISAHALCWGNTADVNGRIFKLTIRESNSTRDVAVVISSDTAKEALDREIEKKAKKIKALKEEFSML